MITSDLFDDNQREPYQQAIDKLEVARINDLNAKLDIIKQRIQHEKLSPEHVEALKNEYVNIKAERDQLFGIGEPRDAALVQEEETEKKYTIKGDSFGNFAIVDNSGNKVKEFSREKYGKNAFNSAESFLNKKFAEAQIESTEQWANAAAATTARTKRVGRVKQEQPTMEHGGGMGMTRWQSVPQSKKYEKPWQAMKESLEQKISEDKEADDKIDALKQSIKLLTKIASDKAVDAKAKQLAQTKITAIQKEIESLKDQQAESVTEWRNSAPGAEEQVKLQHVAIVRKKKHRMSEGTMADAEHHSSGAKFGGYWKGTDKNPPKPGQGFGGMEESEEKENPMGAKELAYLIAKAKGMKPQPDPQLHHGDDHEIHSDKDFVEGASAFKVGDSIWVRNQGGEQVTGEVVELRPGTVVFQTKDGKRFRAPEGRVMANFHEDKIKGADGKACWDGYRYDGTEGGKDKCVKVGEDGLDEEERVDPILLKALKRMPDGLATHREVLDAAYDAYAIEKGYLAMKGNHGVTDVYIPKLMGLYKDKHGLTFNEDWQKANKKDKTDGMSPKAVKAYRRENPGSKLKTAVTTKPSKLKAGSKDAKRRKSFCARMSGNKGPMKKPNGDPTPKALALRRWNCEESVAEGWQDFNKVEPYEVCLAGKPVKSFDYYEEARRFHDNWKQKLYREGNQEKADKITLNPIMKEDEVDESFWGNIKVNNAIRRHERKQDAAMAAGDYDAAKKEIRRAAKIDNKFIPDEVDEEYKPVTRPVPQPKKLNPGWALDPTTKAELKRRKDVRNRKGVDESVNFFEWAMAHPEYKTFSKDAEVYGQARKVFESMINNMTSKISGEVRKVKTPQQLRNKATKLPKPGSIFKEEESDELQPGQYYVWKVYFDDGTESKCKVTSNEFDPKAYYAKKNKNVINVDYDWTVHG